MVEIMSLTAAQVAALTIGQAVTYQSSDPALPASQNGTVTINDGATLQVILADSSGITFPLANNQNGIPTLSLPSS
jgi:hypothetical protein